MSSTTFDISARFSAQQVDQIVQALQTILSQSKKTGEGASEGFVKWGKAVEGVKQILGALGVAVGLAEAVRAVKDLFDQTSELAQQLGNANQQLGGLTAGAVGLAVAARITDTDFTRLKTGVVSLAGAISALKSGQLTPAADALKRLGLSAKDFDGQDLSTQLELVASRLAKIGPGLDKSTIAADIFGKKVGLELIPILNFLGRVGLEGARKQIEGLFSREAIARVNDMRESFALLDFQVKGLALQFLSGLAPAVSEALAQISRDLSGVGAQSIEGWGQAWGFWIARVLLKLDELVDHTQNRLQMLKALLSDRGLPFGGNTSTDEVAATLQKLEDAGHARDAQRAKELADIKAGRLAPTEVPAGTDAAAGEDAAQKSKQRIDVAKALAQAELEVTKSLLKAEEAINRDSFDRGLESIRGYYAERRRIQQESFQAELRAARAQADNEVNVLKAQRDTDLAGAQKRLQELTSAPIGDVAAQAKVASAESAAEVLQVQSQITAIQKRSEIDLSEAETRRSEKLKELSRTEQKLAIENGAAQRAIDAEEAVSVQELADKRVALEARVAALRGDHHREALADDDAELKKAEDLAVKIGAGLKRGQAGPPIPTELLNDNQRSVLKLIDDLHSGLDSATAFEDKLRDAQRAQNTLDTARARIQDDVAAGVKSQVVAQRELLQLDEQSVTHLRELAVQLRTIAGDNPDFTKTADEFERQARAIELRVQAANDVTLVFKSTLQDASVSALSEFLSRGTGQAHGFRDAVLSIIGALRQLASQLIATAIVRAATALFGGAAVAGGGGGFTPRLEQVRAGGGLVERRARGGIVRGFARGGPVMFRGPGTGTSDSIFTHVPRGTFILNARASAIAANVRRLREIYAEAGAHFERSLASGGSAIPVRVSHGEIGIEPDVVRLPGVLQELEAMNRGSRPVRLRTPHFAEGGLTAALATVASGAGAGAAGRDGSSGSDGMTRVQIEHSEDVIVRKIEQVFASPRGPRIMVSAVARAPKTVKRVLGRG